MADALDPAPSIVELMVITAWADGKVEGAEALAVHQQVAAHPLLQKVKSTAEISKRARARLQEVGLEDALREAAQRVQEPRLRELAFQCCVRVMGADSDFDAHEAQVLATLQEAFALSNADVKRLMVLASQR